MYSLAVLKKKQKPDDHDYVFKDFESFYALASSITVGFKGKYSVGIMCEKTKDILEFINQEELYRIFNIVIYTNKSVAEYISLYNTNVQMRDELSTFEIFKNLLAENKVYLDKNIISVFYNSIEHGIDEMESAVKACVNEYGEGVLITEKMLSKLFILNKIVYPRQVLIAYLNLDRWRGFKLKRCLDDISNDVVIGAFVKNIKLLMEEKEKYFKTGVAPNYVKNINTTNLHIMYRVFITERCGLNDIELLLYLYERGLTPYDIIYKNSYQ